MLFKKGSSNYIVEACYFSCLREQNGEKENADTS